MLATDLNENRIHFGQRFSVGFQRTLRIPEDGREYPLPPGLGLFPIYRVADYAANLPGHWNGRGDYFISLYQREALWIGFNGQYWKPNAVKVGVGGINAVSGTILDELLHDDPQDYLVCPDQPWLDGINSGNQSVRQFVAMPLGRNYTIEGQITGDETIGGMQILVFEPKPGMFPDVPPPRQPGTDVLFSFSSEPRMGLGAGGAIHQKIYPDRHGISTWSATSLGTARVHILNSGQFAKVTGKQPPLTPISAETYIKHGYPWFELYDELETSLAAAPTLTAIESVETILNEEKETDPVDPVGGKN